MGSEMCIRDSCRWQYLQECFFKHALAETVNEIMEEQERVAQIADEIKNGIK